MSSPDERWEKARELFDAARGLPSEERAAFLEAACPDAALRGEVETLLRAHAALESTEADFLEGLDAERAAELLVSDGEQEGAGTTEVADLTAGDALGRYRIVRRLGEGGMGVVYLAHDARLGRLAALKLLPRHLGLDAAARHRFEEEARAASVLDHPNIATVYEVGDAPDGRLFIAMAYYEGETLRQELEHGPLPIARALALATQIAEGLAAAHRQGIVHRDVKPANVVVTPDGVAKLVDFGIAKIAGSALTQTGATPGTVAYMSPEQTAGEVVDPRADVWALGATLYEMLAGRRPFRAEGEQALIYAIRHDEPAPLDRLRPEVPPELARIVARCLPKDAAERYRDAGALLTDLRALQEGRVTSSAGDPEEGLVRSKARSRRAAVRYVVLGLPVLLLLGALALWSARGGGRAPDAADAAPGAGIRVAVLPLANQSPDPEDAFLADAMTEELISGLSDLPDIRVIAHTSIILFRDPERNAAEMGRELGVAALLTGALRKAADRVHLSLQLVDAANDDRLWVHDYDADIGDISTVRREIVAHVGGALNVAAQAVGRRAADREPARADAYIEYLKGRYFLSKRDEHSFATARDHFQRALDLDPTFAQAWSGLSDSYDHLASLAGLSAHEAYPRARAAAERALALDPELAGAHAALAAVLSSYYWEGEAAERHFRRAIQLDPSYARAYEAYAKHLRNLGRFDDALIEARNAQELDPLSASSHIEEAIIHYVAGRYDEAIAKFQRLLAAAPDLTYAHHGLALNYAHQGRYDEALAALDRIRPPHVNTNAIRGTVYAMAGRDAAARRMLTTLDLLARGQPVSSFHKAAIHAHLGEHDRAFELLERAAEERASYLRLLRVEPTFDPLRADPRFTELLRRAGLEN